MDSLHKIVFAFLMIPIHAVFCGDMTCKKLQDQNTKLRKDIQCKDRGKNVSF